MARRSRQHWLPRAYLRPFRAGANDTVFVMDFLTDSPRWERVGFYDVGNTGDFHSISSLDQRIDNELVNAYGAIRDKILTLTTSVPLSSVLSSTEIESLAQFIQVHAWRNPLMSYRLLMHGLIETTIDHPWRLPPLRTPLQVLREIIRFRWLFFRKRRTYSESDKQAIIVRRVRAMIQEDGHAHLFLRSHAFVDRALDEFMDVGTPVKLHNPVIMWSDRPLFTMDMPFVLEGDPGVAGVTLAISPHHLLIAGTPGDPSDVNAPPLQRLAHLPYMSFSTKLIASEPMDVTLLALAQIKHVDGSETFGFVEDELVNVPVSDRFGPDAPVEQRYRADGQELH